MFDDRLTVHDVFVGPAFVAGLGTLVFCAVWCMVVRKKKTQASYPYWLRVLLVSRLCLLAFAVWGMFFLPHSPLH